MVHIEDTERAVQLLAKYCRNLPELEEEQLQVAIGKITNIFKSDLFRALLDIQEFYEVTLVAALKPTDQNLVASSLSSAEVGRTSAFTSIELLSPENKS
ncbi:disks large homolog 1-like isoform X2 [Mustelus asterias]